MSESPGGMTMRVVPLTLAEANAYVKHIHRHNGPLPSARLSVALIDHYGVVHGVAVAGIPKARSLMDRGTMEINRVGTDGIRNGCSMLYAAITRACRALGYSRLVTYTLASEPGTSLKASGWTAVADSPGGSWSRGRQACRVDTHDTGPKVRWEIHLAPPCPILQWPSYESENAGAMQLFDLLDGGGVA